jgi:hypothetical protein
MYHFNSHVISQYLQQRCGLSQQQLLEEMNKYYSQPCWELTLTKYAKVNGVKLKPLHPRPPVQPPKPVDRPKSASKFKSKPHKPTVTHKRRRVLHMPGNLG